MNAKQPNRGLLSRVVAAALLFSYLLTLFPAALAEEVPETLPAETEVQCNLAEETLPPEPTELPETQPEEPDIPPEIDPEAPSEEPVPPETAPEEPIPEEVIPEETVPAETLPAETVPEEHSRDDAAVTSPTLSSIRYVRTLQPGMEAAIQGTVTYADETLLVLEDSSGGLPLEPIENVAPGDVLRVTGLCGDLFTVTDCQWIKQQPLPCREAALSGLTEQMTYTRILLREVQLTEDSLTDGSITLALMGAVPEEVHPGATVDALGIYTGDSFLLESMTILDDGSEAAVAAVTAHPAGGILAAGDPITLSCETEGAAIFYSLSTDGTNFCAPISYTHPILPPEEHAQLHLTVWAEKEGCQPGPEQTYFYLVENEAAGSCVFGLLHGHSNLSDTTLMAPEERFALASQGENMDFYALTEYSHSLEATEIRSISSDGAAISQDWAQGKAAAATATTGDFLAIFGYELAWGKTSKIGHMSTFATPGWEGDFSAFPTPEAYYRKLTAVPGSISQWNHPETGNFHNFSGYQPEFDRVIHLLELTERNGIPDITQYGKALDAGWHVAPTLSPDQADPNWNKAESVRTAVVTKDLTEEGLFEAIRSHRVYATQDSDLEILFDIDGSPMGSTLYYPGNFLNVTLWDPTDPEAATVTVLTEEGKELCSEEIFSAQSLSIPIFEEYSYYFLKITQADGDTAVTAPVWVDLQPDITLEPLKADAETLISGQEVTITATITNNTQEDFVVTRITAGANGTPLSGGEAPVTVPAAGSRKCQFSCLVEDALFQEDCVTFSVTASGSLGDRVLLLGPEKLTLKKHQEPAVSADIEEVRKEENLGKRFVISGYATSGTAVPGNTFPDTLYLQDRSGGIEIYPISVPDLQVGTPLTVVGTLTIREENYVFQPESWEILPKSMYLYDPVTISNSAAASYETRGGQLVQVEGKVVSLTRTPDGRGISQCTLQDSRGQRITVFVEDFIRSAASGENTLAEDVRIGRTVRARGLVHRQNGETVIRVRNCDEVVYVPPTPKPASRPDTTNPKTGDPITVPALVGLSSALSLCALLRRKKRK